MVKFTKNFELDVPSWDEIFFNFNYSFINNKPIKNTSFGFFVSHYAHTIPKVKNVLEKLGLREAHSYINITNSPTFGEHKDDVDVWFWQVQGSTKWIIEKDKEFVLKIGDLIYIPKGILHNVIPLGPRVGISMSK